MARFAIFAVFAIASVSAQSALRLEDTNGACVITKESGGLQSSCALLNYATSSDLSSEILLLQNQINQINETLHNALSNTGGSGGTTPCIGSSCGNDGSTAVKAGESCASLLMQSLTNTDGIYWIKPSNAAAYQVYCDMTTDGGGWTLVMKSSDSSTYTYDNSVWTSTSAFGATGPTNPTTNADAVSQAFYDLRGMQSRICMGSQGHCNGWNHQSNTARNLANQPKITSYQSSFPYSGSFFVQKNQIPANIFASTPGTSANYWSRFGYVNDNNGWGINVRVGYSGDIDTSDSADTCMGMGLKCTSNCLTASATGAAHGTGAGWYFYTSGATGDMDGAQKAWLWVY